ncbi:nucleotidyltransferase family protein [Brevibacterium atlanticum]|uniref:nucleotidyltransferase family protein n=1 Tax=Brevibacterium atlanticum TaxID=2697563 RepID=UPI00141E4D24|nr:nucleotidyltransferase domain-containing protein [Brevibacterium atlanticum]
MKSAVVLDTDAIRSACERFGVERLRIFGSVLTDRFNPETSDIDFLVTFQPGRENLFHDYFDLKSELERIVGRRVDLVTERSVKNPFFKAAAFGSAQDVYAA